MVRTSPSAGCKRPRRGNSPNLQKDADRDRGRRGLVLCALRALPGQVPGAGGRPSDLLNLGAMGIHGNGHMMMLEKNSDQIAEVMERWVRKAVSEKTAGVAARHAAQ